MTAFERDASVSAEAFFLKEDDVRLQQMRDQILYDSREAARERVVSWTLSAGFFKRPIVAFAGLCDW